MPKKAPETMNFNVVQTHNNFDCESTTKDGRSGMSRRVDRRIGYIITALGQTPAGFQTVSHLVTRLNKLHKGAAYRYGDIYPTLIRMGTVGLIRRDSGGAWILTDKAREKFQAINKNLRSL